jgi:hypothetical protein
MGSVGGMRRGLDILVLVGLAVGLAACGGGSNNGGSTGGSISSRPLAGTINGQPWTFVAGETDFFLSSMGTTYFTSLYDVSPATPCTPGGPANAKNQIILRIPKMPGHYTQGGTFVFPDPTTGRPDNDIALTGALDVTSISATEIVGGVKMEFDAKNSVDGQFTVNICAQ